MHGIGSKLSKHVLGMKFMRKTKDQLDKTHVEQKHREHFTSDVKPNSTSSTFQKLETIVEEVPSYSQCLGFKFGRQSFGGFNPTVEYNVRKRNWRAVQVGNISSDEDLSEEEEDVKPKAEMDVDDEEMAETYGSIIGTVGRQMMDRNEEKPKARRNKWRKRDKPGEGKGQDQEGVWGTSEEIAVKSTGGGWTKKGFRSKEKKAKNLRDQPSEPSSSKYTKSGHYNEEDSHSQSRRQWQKKSKKEPSAPPPQKKRKFMKPSEEDY